MDYRPLTPRRVGGRSDLFRSSEDTIAQPLPGNCCLLDCNSPQGLQSKISTVQEVYGGQHERRLLPEDQAPYLRP